MSKQKKKNIKKSKAEKNDAEEVVEDQNPLRSSDLLEDIVEASDAEMSQKEVEEGLAAESLPDSEESAEEPADDVIPENLELVQVRSVIESVLLAADKPINVSQLKEIFKGTGTPTDLIRRSLNDLLVEYAGAERGMTLIEVSGGYQLRTKPENMVFVRRLVKGRPFKLSGPALEVLSIVAYKQPIIKAEVDAIRGVESGHLVRALMDRSLVKFVGKSELPGKPMLYGTTRKFLEIFGLRDLRELPSLSEIDQLLPDGMTEEESKPERDWDTIQQLSMEAKPEIDNEEEWGRITEEIQKIETTTEFFEKEKEREKLARDMERAEVLKEALDQGEELTGRDKKWLERFQQAQMQKAVEEFEKDDAPAAESEASENMESAEFVDVEAAQEAEVIVEADVVGSAELSEELEVSAEEAEPEPSEPEPQL